MIGKMNPRSARLLTCGERLLRTLISVTQSYSPLRAGSPLRSDKEGIRRGGEHKGNFTQSNYKDTT